jgi:hypothetical protein
MTIRKMKPCPKCGRTDLSIYTYDNGWRHLECDEGFLRRISRPTTPRFEGR